MAAVHHLHRPPCTTGNGTGAPSSTESVHHGLRNACTTGPAYAYYYLSKILPEINAKLHTNFNMDDAFVSSMFRNAMAHYKIGVALKPSEIIHNDPFFGLTQKFFHCDYYTTKQFVLDNLNALASQIKAYLHIDKG